MTEINERSMVYKISFIFFCIFLFFSGISISISQAALALSLIIWLYGLFSNDKSISYYKSGLEKYIIVFVIVSFILSFLSRPVLGNLLYLKDFWLISVFVLSSSLIKTRSDLEKILKLIIVIALINSLAGLIEFISDFDFINAFRYGLADRRAHYSPDFRHVAGFLGQHLTYGGYMMMIAVPLIYLSFIKKKDLGLKFIWSIRGSALISTAAVIISWARSVIISMPVMVFPLFYRKMKYFISLIIFIVVFIGIIFSSFGPAENIKKNIFDPSTKIRMIIWHTVLNVWLKNPVFGTGGGNFKKEFKIEMNKLIEGPYKKDFRENWHINYNLGTLFKEGTHAHNDYLNQLARKGIIGLAAFLFMFSGIFRYLVINVKFLDDRFMRYLYLGLFGAYCCFLIASMFQCYFTDEENLVMFWFTIGLGVSIVKIIKIENNSKT